MIDEPDIVIEYSLDGGTRWHHGMTVAGWVARDKAMLAAQRAAARTFARAEHGHVGAVATRWLSAGDPRGVLNQPAQAADPAARLERIITLLNRYGEAMVGDQWWPGNASAYLPGPEGAELEALLESTP